MSTITSQRNSDNHLLVGFDKAVMSMGESYIRNKRFGIGQLPSRDDFQELKRLEKIVCSGSCSVGTELYKKVKERLNKLSKKYM